MPPIIFNRKPLCYDKDIKHITVNQDACYITYYNTVKNKNKTKVSADDKKEKKFENKPLAKLTDNEDKINI